MNVPILTLLIIIPLIGALAILFIREPQANANAPRVALLTSGITLFLSLFAWYKFDLLFSDFQFVERYLWLSSLNSYYYLGLDGYSILFVVLTAFLVFLCFIHRFSVKRIREYYICFLLLESFMMGVFCSLDLVLFYIFFEAVLIPMFLIIGIWGGERRIYSTFKFFLFTLLGSVLMLVAVVTLYFEAGTTDIQQIQSFSFGFELQKLLWVAMFVAFAVKIPMWPLHTWLPDAHTEAPTAGSMILAGILLKLGGYGMLRVLIPFFPDASFYFAPVVFALSIIAIIYTSLVALVQTDMKKLIAYSSIAHMGFVTLGIFTLNPQAVSGAMIQMISHGIVSAALFFCVGVVYERFHSREIAHYGGLANKMPRYAVFFMLFTLASIGLPGTSGFVGEFLVIVGTFKVTPSFAVFAVLGVVLSATYALWLYRRIFFDKLNMNFLDLKNITDLKSSEILVLGMLVAPVFWMGLYPAAFTQVLMPPTKRLINEFQKQRKVQTQIFMPQKQASPFAIPKKKAKKG